VAMLLTLSTWSTGHSSTALPSSVYSGERSSWRRSFALVSLRRHPGGSSCWRSPVLVPAPGPVARSSTTRSPRAVRRDRRSLALGGWGEPALAPLIERPLHALPLLSFAHAISAVIAFACITYLQVILGELVPESGRLSASRAACTRRAPPMLVFIRLTGPLCIHERARRAWFYGCFAPSPSARRSVHSPDRVEADGDCYPAQGLLPPYQEALIHRASN